jgi:O-6-methylguanine DNA methyltransferase
MPAITFDSHICPITIEFTHRKVTRLKLHSVASKAGTESSGGVPAWLQTLVVRIKKHMLGERQDFQDVPLDLSGRSEFAQLVYSALRRVPAGETISYGELAALVGRPTAARGVASAMAANPIPLLIPCHRVVGAKGQLTGFSGADGLATKARMLEAEGALSPSSSLLG